MTPNADRSKAPEPKPSASAESKPKVPASTPGPKTDAKTDAKDDLKTLPLAEVEKKLGTSPDGLTQAEAQKRLTQYGPNELE
jgi:H+-transporting ATPase